MSRDDVLNEYTGCGWDYPEYENMADEIVRLRAILAALREPSEAVVKAAASTYFTTEALQRAVAAAEREVAAEEQKMVRDAITVHGGRPTVELVRFSQSGIWVNPDIPIDEVAQQVFALLEPMIVQSYTKAAAAAAEQEVADEVR